MANNDLEVLRDKEILDFLPSELLLDAEEIELPPPSDDEGWDITPNLSAKYMLEDDVYHSTEINPEYPEQYLARRPLSKDEQKRLNELEKRMDTVEKANILTALAVYEIKAKKLYWFQAPSFKQYLIERDISRPQAYKLMKAAVAYIAIRESIRSPRPWRISHLLALQGLQAKAMICAYDTAYEQYGKKLTAPKIKKTIAELRLEAHKQHREKKSRKDDDDNYTPDYLERATAHVASIVKDAKHLIGAGGNKKENSKVFNEDLLKMRKLLYGGIEEINKLLAGWEPEP